MGHFWFTFVSTNLQYRCSPATTPCASGVNFRLVKKAASFASGSIFRQ